VTFRWDDRDVNERRTLCAQKFFLQCGDQWRELTDVQREIVSGGSGLWFDI
jgi:hypothetical protein